MTSKETIHRDPEDRYPEPCPHCFGGIVYEPTEDELVDEPHEGHMCMGTARKMDRAERLSIRAGR